jgi:hypothetical protein
VADEISGGPPAPGRGRTALITVVVAAVAVAGVLALRRGTDPAPVAGPTAAVIPPPPLETLTASPGRPPGLALTEVCQPYGTDGRSSLTVSFTLVNTTSVPIMLVALTPVLPLHGITPRGVEMRTGGCSGTGPRFAAGGRVDVGGTIRATFRFALPAECPAANPVLAGVRERTDPGPVRDWTYTVFNDLGRVPLTTCD